MALCISGNGSYQLQLETIYKDIILNNNTSYEFAPNQISITILPTSQPIGFCMEYKNLGSIVANSSGLLQLKQLGNDIFQYPKVARKMKIIPSDVDLKVIITISGNPINPQYIPISLVTTTNGKVTEIIANALYGEIKTIFYLNYSFVKMNCLYKWVILSSTITLVN